MTPVERVLAALEAQGGGGMAGRTRGILPAVKLWKGKRRTFLRFRSSGIEAVIAERCASARDPRSYR